MNIKDQRCVTALFKARLDVGGVCELPACVYLCVSGGG